MQTDPNELMATGWSDRTLKSMTKIELEELEYAVQEAGFEAKASMPYDDPALTLYLDSVEQLQNAIEHELDSRVNVLSLYTWERAERVMF